MLKRYSSENQASSNNTKSDDFEQMGVTGMNHIYNGNLQSITLIKGLAKYLGTCEEVETLVNSSKSIQTI